MPLTADKHRVREYIIEKLGEKDGKEVLVPLLYVTDNPKTIPFDELPTKYIIKSNFGSGQNLIIDENSTYTKKEIINKCKKWLQKSYGVMYHEWAYQKIERKIVVEELLLDENGNIPKDFKFFVFNGKCEMVQVDSDRFEESARTLTLYTREWKIIPATKSMQKQGNEISKPLAYTRMLELAELLGMNFDFVRVDLYAIKDNIYFGEMTHYPKSGMGKFTPQSFDLALGHKWRIAPRYWE